MNTRRLVDAQRLAEFETNIRKERQLEGIAKAKAEGVYKGRPATINQAQGGRIGRQRDCAAAQDWPGECLPCDGRLNVPTAGVTAGSPRDQRRIQRLATQ